MTDLEFKVCAKVCAGQNGRPNNQRVAHKLLKNIGAR